MEAVMISIRPHWCHLIANRKKTIEVRKTRPKLEMPFRCFIYCTSGNRHEAVLVSNGRTSYAAVFNWRTAVPCGAEIGNGKVIGEFICDHVYQYTTTSVRDGADISDADMARFSCLDHTELVMYENSGKIQDFRLSKFGLFGWHISDLKIYDQPREIADFASASSYLTFDKGGYCENMVWSGMKRPPQSWCYVEARHEKGKGLNDYAVAGLMGNLYAESGLRPNNLQNTYESKLSMSDAEYTACVDNGTYGNFVADKAGYGLAQWTYHTRKRGLYEYAKAQGKSIGDLQMQLEYLWKELQGYTVVMATLKKATSVRAASDVVLMKFEAPADQGEAVQQRRAGYGQIYYDKFAKEDDDMITLDQFKELWGEMRKGLQDNDSSEYSKAAREWAVSTGLIAGGGKLPDGSANYMWEDVLKREQFVTLLYRFAQMMGKV